MEQEVGSVFSFFNKINVAAVKLKGALSVGDRIKIKGHTTEFEQTLTSMQIEGKNVAKAKKGDDIGIKVADRVRPGDIIYKI